MLSLGLLLDIVPDGSLHIVSIHRNRFFQGTLCVLPFLQDYSTPSSYQQVT